MSESCRMSELWPVELESVRAAVLEVLGDVTDVERLAGGVQGGAWRVRAEHSHAVLKARPWAHDLHLEQMETSGRVTDRLRAAGYPTPRWLATGASKVLVWQLQEYVDASHSRAFDDDIIDELLGVLSSNKALVKKAATGVRTRGGCWPARSPRSTTSVASLRRLRRSSTGSGQTLHATRPVRSRVTTSFTGTSTRATSLSAMATSWP